MAKGTFVQEGRTLDFTNGTAADIGYRDVIPAGGRIFIAGEDIKIGATGSVYAHGVWELPADNTVAFALGDTLYWDDAAGKLTKTAGTYAAGFAAAPKAQAEATALVNIG